jgi:glutamate--cysteine ligase
MSGPDTPNQPVLDRNDLVSALEKGCKPPAAWRIGTEHEKFVFHTRDNSPVAYEGENGIGALLEALAARTDWAPINDHGRIIGLKDEANLASISLEPGGQFELSGAALMDMHETCSETHAHLRLLSEIAEPMGLGFLALGVAPTWTMDEVARMPKSRYAIMAPYMEKVGTLGTTMMFRSCTVQANLDFSSEADMVDKLRVGLALQPIATALFANSPFVDGRPSGFLSFRSHVWQNTDPDRTGMLPFAFEEGMGFERYVDYALDVPMYLVVRDGEYINCAGESFRKFFEGKLPQLPGEYPTLADWEEHLTTIFPEVRLKSFLEMRGADCGRWEEICALPALWTGLFYDRDALRAALDLINDWTEAERHRLRTDVARTALATPFRGGTVLDIARQVLAISRKGLLARNVRNFENFDEAIFLAPLDAIADSGRTRADELLELYEGEWEGDLSRVFKARAY